MRQGKNKSTKNKKNQDVSTVDNHKITEYFYVRRSSRKTESELKKEKEMNVENAIISNSENGLRIVISPRKGRGIVATQAFARGDFVVEYRGDLVSLESAKKRESEYEKDSDIGCYMYYFIHKNKQYCVDATAESGYLGRLVNHSAKRPNLMTKTVEISGTPHLVLMARRDISIGEELLYDYGDRNQVTVASNPWLVKS